MRVGDTDLEASETRREVGDALRVVVAANFEEGGAERATEDAVDASRGRPCNVVRGRRRVQRDDRGVRGAVGHLVTSGVFRADQDFTERALDLDVAFVDLVGAVSFAFQLDVGADLDAVVQSDRRQEEDFCVGRDVDTVEVLRIARCQIGGRISNHRVVVAADANVPLCSAGRSGHGTGDCDRAGTQEYFFHDVPLSVSHV